MARHLLFGSRDASSEGGFTILEALIAITILAVGILAVASLQGSAIKSNGSAMELADATARISSKLEALTMLGFTDLDLEEGDHEAQSDQYTITWKVKDSLSDDTKTIDINAKLKDRDIWKRPMRHILSNNRS